MAAIHELLKQVQDPALRVRLTEEFEHITQNKKFGLVFEEHMPECTPLYGIGIKKGGTVAKKSAKISDTYTVLKINKDLAMCRKKNTGITEPIKMSDLIAVAEFGEPIFPYLEHIDIVENAPESDLWHTLIEADNYHALQLLEYLYAGKVDCIYIDPPYNTGARDWKYNNDYVDSSDAYRHSKWLSMMKKRLKLAKRLLNPEDSVLIVTIDEKEYLHLGCLLEEMFSEARIQMVSITINPSGAKRDNEFSRADEYAFFIFIGSSHVIHPRGVGEEQEVRWWYLRRTDYASRRGTVKGGVAQFYPIYVDDATKRIVHIGNPLGPNEDRHSVPVIPGATAVFPVRDDGVEMNWGLTGDSLRKLIDEGVVRVTAGSQNQPYVFRYVSANYKQKIKLGRWAIRGTRDDGSKIIVEVEGKVTRATTVWQNKWHDAGQYGTSMLHQIIGPGRFNFPKSVYAVQDTLRFFVKEKPDALIIDFFAGSGTTLHAVNLLNAEDGGHRRCIMVTNNEVSDAEAKTLKKQGWQPGDEEWEKFGIARYVTWPRTVCSIEGHDINGKPLKGNYIGSDTPMSDGFSANCEYFKLGFLDRDMVSLGRQFREILPLLWMKSGAVGRRPDYLGEEEPQMLVLPENHFAVLVDETCYAAFAKRVQECDNIQSVYFITNSETAYHDMAQDLGIADSYQLYRNYIDNFMIGARRDRI